ncbi:MAG TPA: cupredoxin domain-containing protein [Acidimicrobiia bacterium]|nr:cupredoxin domain-containing protein [Acidimicrobiia bacterium]
MRLRPTIAAAVVLPAVATMSGLALGGGGASGAPRPKPTCRPDGPALSVAAEHDAFDKDCLAAPAGTAFQIAFDNEDSDIHNVAIYDKDHGDKALFKGEVIYGPKRITYSVPALAEGTYEFRCDPHPDSMIGTFVVGSGAPAAEQDAQSGGQRF